MSTPRYVPRTFLQARYRFGRGTVPGGAWEVPKDKTPDVRDEVYVTAARIQNDLVAQVNKVLHRTATKPSTVCAAGHFTLQRWQRVRRGDIVLRLEDLAAIEIATGYTVSLHFKDSTGDGYAAVNDSREQEAEAIKQRELISRLSRVRS